MHLGDPLAYFLTFHTYGTWLHGSEKGSVDRERNTFGHAVIEPNARFEQLRRASMRQPEMLLASEQRQRVEEAIREVCKHRSWKINAINVRTNHVHVVVTGGNKPEAMLGDFKRYATRRLRESGLIDATRLVWAEHGSTRYLWELDDIESCCRYVRHSQ